MSESTIKGGTVEITKNTWKYIKPGLSLGEWQLDGYDKTYAAVVDVHELIGEKDGLKYGFIVYDGDGIEATFGERATLETAQAAAEKALQVLGASLV